MKQYTIEKAWNDSDITKIIATFQTDDLPRYNRRYNEYAGKHKILRKRPTDDGKPCNTSVVNFVNNIVKTYTGYAIGVPVKYSNEDEDITEILDILNYNDVDDEDVNLLQMALIMGRAVEVNYLDSDGKQRFVYQDPRSWIPVYDGTLENKLVMVIRFYCSNPDDITSNYYIDIYTDDALYHYKSSQGYSSMEFIDDEPNYFNQIPVTIFDLNEDGEGICDQVFSLNDAYNALYNDSIDSWEAFVDCFLVLKGVVADPEDLRAMKTNRCLLIDNDASAEFLTKEVNTAEIENLLKTTEAKIREIAGCPNFASEEFATSSGIAIKFRCMQMENNVAGIMNRFKKALQKRIELICSILSLTNEDAWRSVDFKFTRNIPENLEPTSAADIATYRGLVPDSILLEKLPFVKNVDKAIEELNEQRSASMELFGKRDEE